MTRKTTRYTSVVLEEILIDLKKQLGNDLTDEIELLIDEKIRVGVESTEKRFQRLLDRKKDKQNDTTS
jgi:hypothetical protein